MNDYKKILEGVVNIINTTEKSDIGFANICAYIGENCPELVESEDERIRKALKEYFINSFQNNGVAAICGVHIKDILAWLKKQGKTSPILSNSPNIGKVEQKPAGWSEEDRETINYLIDYLESELDSSYTKEDKEEFTKEIELLKSLRPQSQWKPSNMQIMALRWVLNHIPYDSHKEEISGLLEQLKKLREK